MNLKRLCFLTGLILIILKAVGVAQITWIQALLPIIIGIIISLLISITCIILIPKIFKEINKYAIQQEEKK